ncbi:unnamed protein product [Linum tenue]|uniref:Protein odr-4 homolog n=1 Tax=Linum tenue TaxID=586396 RepID=A0AAV0QU38_9ROSI|nr:unnamed protein product [Linum tenue]
MVKVVVGDENQLKLAEDRLTQSGFTAQVGLVIGKLSSPLDRGFVFDLVPTPTNDAGEPACSVVETKDDKKKGGSKSKSQVSDASTLFIDTDWVAEHARQITNDEPCTTDTLHEVELLLPFLECDPATEACSQKNVDGLLVFGGSVCSFTYLNNKEPVSQAVADIKFDIVRSLQSRLDILCDEADQELAAEDEGTEEASQDRLSHKPVSKLALHSLRKTCHLAFPRRVFIPWLGDIYICDYLQPSETLEVIKDHCVELMSMQAPTDASTFFQPEVEAPSVISKSFWDVSVAGNSNNSSSSKSREVDDASPESSNRQLRKTVNFSFSMVAAVLILLMSILLGFVFVRKS